MAGLCEGGAWVRGLFTCFRGCFQKSFANLHVGYGVDAGYLIGVSVSFKPCPALRIVLPAGENRREIKLQQPGGYAESVLLPQRSECNKN